MRLLAVNSGGAGNLHGLRLRRLIEGFAGDVTIVDIDRSSFRAGLAQMTALVKHAAWDLVFMEGTGAAAGLPLIWAGPKLQYVVSAGDPVAGFFRVTQGIAAGAVAAAYERALYRRATGFIGWTPYLTGRALGLGAKRVITIEGSADLRVFRPAQPMERLAARARFALPADHIVCGIVGTLKWVRRQRYCYGLELVKMLAYLQRPDVSVLVVGDGDGRKLLEQHVRPEDRQRVVFTGQLQESDVVQALHAVDIGFIPQSLDQLGQFRLTTKLPEYLGCGVPVAMSPIPGFYDYVGDAGWALPAAHPSSDSFARECAMWIDELSSAEIARARSQARRLAIDRFDYEHLRRRLQRFLVDLAVDGREQRRGQGFRLTDVRRRAPGRPEHEQTANVDNTRSIARIAQSAPRSGARNLLTIGHSYVVGANRRLADEMMRESNGRWNVTVVAPSYFYGSGELRAERFTRLPDEVANATAIKAHLTHRVHLFHYDSKLKEILCGTPWDCIHAWEEPYIWAGGQIARWAPPSIPLVYRTAQSLHKWYPPPFSSIEKFSMNRAVGWICSGCLVEGNLGARELYARKERRLIPLGVDLQAFSRNRSAGGHVLRRLEWEAGPPVIGFLGRFTKAKGLPFLMSVLSQLKTPWRALFVGAGPLEKHLRDWSVGFGHRVRVCTDVQHADVPAYLNAMDIMVAPSQTTTAWREQFGRMLIEAFACGIPVVASDSGEIPHVVRSTGVIVGETDTRAWLQALETLLTDPVERQLLADGAHERARREYSWPVVARQHLDFFDALM